VGLSIKVRSLAAAFAVLLGIAGFANSEPMEGVDYALLDPPVILPGPQVQVAEFFHYGCEACYRLEPLLTPWLAGLPDDVLFLKVPALRRRDWIPLTRLFFALDSLGELKRLNGEVFSAIHDRKINLGDSTRAIEWAADNGIDRAAFSAALDSKDIDLRVQRARDLTEVFGIQDTPSIVVDGRYLTSAAMVGNMNALLPVVDGLIAKARALRAKQ